MFTVIDNKDQWNAILKEVDTYNLYHTYEYHQITKSSEEAPVMICFSENNRPIAIPLLLRRIPYSNYKDCTSIYGYAGLWVILNGLA
ncbi:hypothetical protein [Arenibacter certesii]|uniref:Uncharacterized protein n=1 Tax=Arenibacter certesii TaxID=228955 RepID=A0A918MNS3_9FLAO|nr:hypothetical protein [Arenibacter certesii]GGW40767.1 hypothetical protein GCM10007383_26990 [Arenibacter certesii]